MSLNRLRRLTVVLAVWAAAGGWCDAAHAIITQDVHVAFEDLGGFTVFEESRDMVDNTATGTIDRDILAGLNGTFGRATSTAGRFGNIAMEALFIGPPATMLTTRVNIFSDEFINQTGQPQRAEAKFIIDGGFIDMTAGQDSRVFYQLFISAGLVDPLGTLRSFPGSFVSQGTLRETGMFGGDAEFSIFGGEDIGAVHTPGTGRVDIPFSFQDIDLGIVPSGWSIQLEYRMQIEASIENFVEGIIWEFSDPGSIDGFGDFPTVTFTPVGPGGGGGGVPEPGAASLLAMAALLCTRRRVRFSKSLRS